MTNSFVSIEIDIQVVSVDEVSRFKLIDRIANQEKYVAVEGLVDRPKNITRTD